MKKEYERYTPDIEEIVQKQGAEFLKLALETEKLAINYILRAEKEAKNTNDMGNNKLSPYYQEKLFEMELQIKKTTDQLRKIHKVLEKEFK